MAPQTAPPAAAAPATESGGFEEDPAPPPPSCGRLARLVSELRDGVDADGGFPVGAIINGDLERSLTRFLVAADFDVPRAIKAVAAMRAWRESYGVDALLTSWVPSDATLAMLRMRLPSSYHGYDREGHPIHLEHTGAFDFSCVRFQDDNSNDKRAPSKKKGARRARRKHSRHAGKEDESASSPPPSSAVAAVPADDARVSAEDLVRLHVLLMEYQVRVLFPRASARAGRPIDRMTNVLDLEGLSLSVLAHRRALGVFKEVQRIDQSYYPGLLHRTYVVNAGPVFRAAWRVLQVVFPAQEKRKMVVVPRQKERKREVLAHAIAEEWIPASVCDCTGARKGKGGGPPYECISGPKGTGEAPTAHQAAMLEDLRAIREAATREGGGEGGGEPAGM